MDKAFHRLETRDRLIDPISPLLANDDPIGLRLVDEISQQLTFGRCVERNRNSTYFPQSPHNEKEVRAVRQHHGHVLPFRYPQRAEAIRVTVRYLVQVGIRVAGVLP